MRTCVLDIANINWEIVITRRISELAGCLPVQGCFSSRGPGGIFQTETIQRQKIPLLLAKMMDIKARSSPDRTKFPVTAGRTETLEEEILDKQKTTHGDRKLRNMSFSKRETHTL